MLGHQDVGGDEEIDPARTEVQRQAECAAVVADHRVAAREVEPVDRAEIDRPGDVVQRLVFPEAHRVEQAHAGAVLPHLVFEPGVHRGAQHARRAAGLLLLEFEYVEVEVGLRARALAVHGDARELHVLDRTARKGVALAPADEAQVVDRQRSLQVGQDVVRGAQIDGETVTRRAGGLEVDVVECVNHLAAVVHLGRGLQPGGRNVERSVGLDGPAVLVQRYVEAVEVGLRADDSGEELAAHADVEAVVEQRERIGEGRLEVGVADYADVADAPLLPVLDEVEERVGDVGFGVGPYVEVERPEILAVFRVGAESDDVDAGVRPQQVFVLEARKRLGGRYGAVEQRHEFPVAGIEDLVERDVAAHADLDASQHGEVHVAALRCEGRVELAAEGRAFHEVGRGVLGCGADRYEKRRQ